jgi:DNA-binding NtrC family response regulator
LKNVIERALILESTPDLQPSSLPDFKLEGQLHKTPVTFPTGDQSLDDMLGNVERDLISAMLERNQFNLNKTAEQLKITRHALRYRMQRLNMVSAADEEAPADKDRKP